MAELIVIKTFPNRLEAEQAKGLLTEGGIDSIVSADDAGGFYSSIAWSMGGVRLSVRKDDFGKAKEVLKVLEDESSPNEESIRLADQSRKKLLQYGCGALGIFAVVLGWFLICPMHYKQYYRTGQLRREFNERFQKLDGLSRKFYLSGKIQSEYFYKNGKLNGIAKKFYENGTIQRESDYRDDMQVGLIKEYHENGILKMQAPNHKELTGSVDVFYPSGKLWEKRIYNHGKRVDDTGRPWNGLHRTFYEDGKLYEEKSFKDGFLDGQLKVYYQNGQYQEVSSYADGNLDGPLTTYYENGNPRETSSYRNNKPIEISEYDTNGRLIFRQ